MKDFIQLIDVFYSVTIYPNQKPQIFRLEAFGLPGRI